MYFSHFAWSTVPQNCCIPSISSSFTFGLTSRRMYSLSSCHRVSMGLRSGDSAGVFHRLMDLSYPLLCHVWRMFWVIVLHEFMPLWIHPLDERYQRLVQDVNKKHCIHKYTDSSPSSSANPGPHMNFRGVLGPIIKTWGIIVRYTGTCMLVQGCDFNSQTCQHAIYVDLIVNLCTLA
jgi:hypothetical protein